MTTEIETGPSFSGATEAPVAAGKRVFVAGVGGKSSPGEAFVHAVDVDRRTTAWIATIPTPAHARDLATSLPLPRGPSRGAWLAVHEFDESIVIHGVDDDGRIDARIELPHENAYYRSCDLASKVMLRLAAAGENVLCSWTYRQIREYGVIAYDPRGTIIWSAPEWLLACDGATTISCPVPSAPAPPDRTTLVVRDAATGTLRWQNDFEDVSVAALAEETLYLVDRGPAFADVRAQEKEVEARFLAGTIAESELDAALDACISRGPIAVRAVDALGGLTRWTLDAGTQVHGLVATARGVAMLVHESDGSFRLLLVSKDGRVISDVVVAHEGRCDATKMADDHAGLVATDETIVVLRPRSWSSFTWDGARCASGEAPERCFGFEPRRSDRWLTVPCATLAAGRLVFRSGPRITIAT